MYIGCFLTPVTPLPEGTAIAWPWEICWIILLLIKCTSVKNNKNGAVTGLSGMSMNGEVQKYTSFFNEVNKSFRLENDISESSRTALLWDDYLSRKWTKSWWWFSIMLVSWFYPFCWSCFCLIFSNVTSRWWVHQNLAVFVGFGPMFGFHPSIVRGNKKNPGRNWTLLVCPSLRVIVWVAVFWNQMFGCQWSGFIGIVVL